MRTRVAIALLTLHAVTGSAQIWSENFNAPVMLNADSQGHINAEYSTGEWIHNSAVQTNGQLRITVAWNGNARGCGISLDEGLFPTAGTYRLEGLCSKSHSQSRLGISVYDAQTGVGDGTAEGESYYLNTTGSGGYTPLTAGAKGSANSTLLISETTNSDFQVDFNYAGGGDVILLFSSMTDIDRLPNRSVTLDNLSVVAILPLPAPTNVMAVAGDGNVQVIWAEIPVSTPASSFNIYRSTTSGSYGTPLATGVSGDEYVDAAVTNGIQYFYVVSAVDENGYGGPFSRESTAYPYPYVIHSLKKGAGTQGGRLAKARMELLGASWQYSWSMNDYVPANEAITYFPMRQHYHWPSLDQLTNHVNADVLLTFNEPNKLQDFGDPTPQQAFDIWPQLEAAAADNNIARIGAPAISRTDSWIVDFMNLAEPTTSAPLRQIDFMNFHCYRPPSHPQAPINDALWYWNTYGRPVWITEFNCGDWSLTYEWDLSDGCSWLAEVQWAFEEADYVERYALWQADDDDQIMNAGWSWYAGTTNLSPFGKQYAAYRTADVNGPYPRAWYHIHNKGTSMRLQQAGNVAAVNSIFTEDASVEFEVRDAGNNEYFIANRLTGEYLHYNGSTLSWSSATGTAAKWNIIDGSRCWDFIEHATHPVRLSASSDGTVSAVANPATSNSAQWTFLRSINLYIPGDSDADGMSDLWETAYSLNPADAADAQHDEDGDKLSNLYELAMGGNPTNAAIEGYSPSFEIVHSGGAIPDVQYIYPYRTDPQAHAIRYVLQTSTNLAEETWMDWINGLGGVGTNAYGAGFDAVTNRQPADLDACFFRLKVFAR